jgi:hypothetical protein
MTMMMMTLNSNNEVLYPIVVAVTVSFSIFIAVSVCML